MDILKSLSSFWTSLAEDLDPRNEYLESLDFVVFKRRFRSEGLPFVTRHFGDYANAFLAEISCRSYDYGRFRTDSDGHPIFLRKLSLRARSGDTKAVRILLQLLRIFSKLPMESAKSESFVQDEWTKFCKTQTGYTGFKLNLLPFETYRGVQQARHLIHRVLENLDPREIIPRHGSGSVANRLSQGEKWNLVPRFNEFVDRVYPYHEYFVFSLQETADLEQETLFDLPTFEKTARVTFVPKTWKSLRLISMEPAELQYLQQGLMMCLYEHIERHPLTRKLVNFRDQSINQELCSVAVAADLATIDMTQASDRVWWDLVQFLFPARWVEALSAVRSTHTSFQDSVVELKCHAPMGSATCFPVEALVFWALVTGVDNSLVTVYGDDIICERGIVSKVMDLFHDLGMLPNEQKSFWTGPYRESCGVEYYNDTEVTQAKLRSLPSGVDDKQGTRAKAWASVTGTYNHLYQLHGFLPKTYDWVTSIYGPQFCDSEVGSLCLPWRASNSVFFKRRLNRTLQREEYFIPALRTGRTSYHCNSPWGEIRRRLLGRDWLLEPELYTDSRKLNRRLSWYSPRRN